jgi:hypothetical protein
MSKSSGTIWAKALTNTGNYIFAIIALSIPFYRINTYRTIPHEWSKNICNGIIAINK